ncbi:MAG: hypothetical protein HY901_28785, partial [Deltaproteobacteria bacterium]|nr:hypothetical protein [Deltaproteobacteria bacterium]
WIASSSWSYWEDLTKEMYTSEEIEAVRAKACRELLEVDIKELRGLAGKPQCQADEDLTDQGGIRQVRSLTLPARTPGS